MKKAKKLNDVSLAEVSGGMGLPLHIPYKYCEYTYRAGEYISLAAAPVTLGLVVADLVCKKKANKNKENGNFEKAGKFEKASDILTKLSVAGGAVTTAGVLLGPGLGFLWDHNVVQWG